MMWIKSFYLNTTKHQVTPRMVNIPGELVHIMIAYYHDISVPTTVTYRDLKGSSGKGGAPDVMEIIKAFQMGNGINL